MEKKEPWKQWREGSLKEQPELIKECFPSLGRGAKQCWFSDLPSFYGLATVVCCPFLSVLNESIYCGHPRPVPLLHIRRMKEGRRQKILCPLSSQVSSPIGLFPWTSHNLKFLSFELDPVTGSDFFVILLVRDINGFCI